MKATFVREFQEYFRTMLGYVFVGAFLFLTSVFFAVNNISAQNADFNTTLNDCIYVFILTAPLLTMKLLADEKRTRRIQLLMTTRTPMSSVIVGKYLAALAVFAVALCCTVIYPITLSIYGTVSPLLILNGYLGFFLLGAAFLAVGIFASAITESQLTAAICTYGFLIAFLCLDMIISRIHVGFITRVLEWFSLFQRFQTFQYGTLSIASVVYYLAFSFVFVFLSISVMAFRRLK